MTPFSATYVCGTQYSGGDVMWEGLASNVVEQETRNTLKIQQEPFCVMR